MKRFVPVTLGIGLLLAGTVQAQTPAANSPSTPATGATSNAPMSNSPSPVAVTTTSELSRTTEAPVPGANSFTESQARARIEERRFAQVTGLAKDDKGVWRGTAMKDGKSVAVALDYQGNVVGQ